MSDIGGVISDCIITYSPPHRGKEMDPISPFLMQSSPALINSRTRLSEVTEEVGYGLRSFVTAGFLSSVWALYQADHQTYFRSENLSHCRTGSGPAGPGHCPGGRKVGNCEILGQYFTLVLWAG